MGVKTFLFICCIFEVSESHFRECVDDYFDSFCIQIGGMGASTIKWKALELCIGLSESDSKLHTVGH